jgi:hypothetical protein
MRAMKFLKLLVPLVGVVLLVVAFQRYGWPGVAAVTGGIVMWILLHFNRMMAVLRKANNQPIGYVGSAVMLNARLKPGSTLLHVMAMTKALGERRSAEGEEPEVYRWTDGTHSWVDCTFNNGRLASWQLTRPQQEPETPETPVTPAP